MNQSPRFSSTQFRPVLQFFAPGEILAPEQTLSFLRRKVASALSRLINASIASLICFASSRIVCSTTTALPIRPGSSVPATPPDRVQAVARSTHHPRIEDLTRAAERHLCLASFSMHGDYHRTLMPLLMFAVIDATALLDEPFSECAAFHRARPLII